MESTRAIHVLGFHPRLGIRMRALLRPWLGTVAERWEAVLRGRSAGLPDDVAQALSALDLRGAAGSQARARAEASLARTRLAEVALVEIDSPDYPPALASIDDPPWLLWVRGSAGALHLPGVAIVGSRNASREGSGIASALAGGLAEAGLCVTSGLARGIDGAAHRGALGAGGTTVAVLGCGVDVCYPREHATLAAQVQRAGALVSEFPPGTPPRPAHFPQRNRVIAGLSQATLVVEASLRSGSLTTAGHALDAGRDVFAVPGPVWSPNSRGVHHLLRQGAGLVESLDDLLAAIGRPGSPPGSRARMPGAARSRAPVTGVAADVLSAIGDRITDLATVAARCRLDAAQLAMVVTELEVLGWVERRGGGIARVP